MNRSARLAASAALGYFLGSIPSARIATRLLAPKEADITRRGSGNPGAANVAAVLGKRAGAAVLGADMAKAALGSIGGRSIVGLVGGHVAGTAAVVGHCYPVWTGFRRGGKGVACSAGQMLATFPAYLPIDIALGVVTAKSSWWRNRKAESTAAACLLWVGLGVIWNRRQLPNLWGGQPTLGLPIAASLSSVAIISKFISEPPPKVDP